MIIEIYGPGCPKCHATKENIQKVVKELGLEQEVEVREVKDISAIINKGVLLTPGVIINGIKVSEGRIPSPQEVRNWIEESK